jgi:hypothetical protein
MSKPRTRKPAGLDRQSSGSSSQPTSLSETEEADVAFFFPALQKFRNTTTIAYRHESLIIVDDTEDSDVTDTEITPSQPKRLKTAEGSSLTVGKQQGLENDSAEEFMKMLFDEEGRAGDSPCDFMFDEALEL